MHELFYIRFEKGGEPRMLKFYLLDLKMKHELMLQKFENSWLIIAKKITRKYRFLRF
jgi:hypothetical protein